jgi:ATP-dependent RNA helicase MSS116
VSFLGFTKTLTKVHGLNAAAVVALANKYSASLGLASPPGIEARIIGKMGLKGVPGLVIKPAQGGGGRPPGRAPNRGGGEGPGPDRPKKRAFSRMGGRP